MRISLVLLLQLLGDGTTIFAHADEGGRVGPGGSVRGTAAVVNYNNNFVGDNNIVSFQNFNGLDAYDILGGEAHPSEQEKAQEILSEAEAQANLRTSSSVDAPVEQQQVPTDPPTESPPVEFPVDILRTDPSATSGVEDLDVGVDICSCSPSTFVFTLEFSLECVNITTTEDSSGVEAVICTLSPFGDEVVLDFLPVSVQSIHIEEVNQNLDQILNQENFQGNFGDGDTFQYTSIAASPDEIDDAVDVPRAIHLTIIGLNKNDQTIVNFYAIGYKNDCSLYPVLEVGQSAGWTRFSDLGPPASELCPMVPTPYPTFLVTPAPKTDAPTEARPTDSPTAGSGSGSSSAGKCPKKRPKEGKPCDESDPHVCHYEQTCCCVGGEEECFHNYECSCGHTYGEDEIDVILQKNHDDGSDRVWMCYHNENDDMCNEEEECSSGKCKCDGSGSGSNSNSGSGSSGSGSSDDSNSEDESSDESSGTSSGSSGSGSGSSGSGSGSSDANEECDGIPSFIYEPRYDVVDPEEGDITWHDNQLFDVMPETAEEEVIGFSSGHCTVLDLDSYMLNCFAQLTFEETVGILTMQGVLEYDNVDGVVDPVTLVVTGGTGCFKRATGSVVLTVSDSDSGLFVYEYDFDHLCLNGSESSESESGSGSSGSSSGSGSGSSPSEDEKKKRNDASFQGLP